MYINILRLQCFFKLSVFIYNRKSRIVSVIKVKFLLRQEEDGRLKEMYLRWMLERRFEFLLFSFVIKHSLRSASNHRFTAEKTAKELQHVTAVLS